jgi:hypothetical protein
MSPDELQRLTEIFERVREPKKVSVFRKLVLLVKKQPTPSKPKPANKDNAV